MDFDEKELNTYNTYLLSMKRRIKELNDLNVDLGMNVLLCEIDIRNIRKRGKNTWSFSYRIDSNHSFSGEILFKDYHTWKNDLLREKRDRRIQQLLDE